MPGSGINITVWSYVDGLNVSVIADDQTVDDRMKPLTRWWQRSTLSVEPIDR